MLNRVMGTFLIIAFLTSALFSLPFSTQGQQSSFCPLLPENGEDEDYGEVEQELEAITETLEDEGFGRVGVTSLILPRDTDQIGIGTYQVNPDIPVQIDIGYVYDSLMETPEQPISVRFYAFLNEGVFDIGETNTQYMDVTLEPHQPFAFSFTLPLLETGIHDLVIIGVPNVDREPVGTAGLADGDNIRSFVRRISLVAGNPETLTVTERDFDKPAVLRDFTDEELLTVQMMAPVTLVPSLTDELFWWVSPETSLGVEAGADYRFNLLTRYQYYGLQAGYELQAENEKLRFALLAFQDYVQMSVGSEGEVMYGEISEDAAEVRLPFEFTAPSEPGRYDLFFVKIDHPGVPFCWLTTHFEASAVETVRTSIEVE